MNDSELLRRYAQTGCEESFTQLVKGYIDFVYSAALRQVGGDAHLAQDVAQSVFVDLAAKARSLSPRTVLSGWLYTSTRYAAAKAVRSDQRWHAREKEATIMQEDSVRDPAEAEWAQLRPLIDQAIHQLKERDRNALLLRYFEGRSLAEVGARLGLSEDAARKQASRALEKLRGLLAKRGITSSASGLAVLLTAQAVSGAPAGIAAHIAGTALASAGTGAGSTFTLFKIITMSKFKAAVLTAVVAATVATPFILQQQTQAKLRTENETLRVQNQQLVDSARQAVERASLPGADAGGSPAAAEQSREVLRLRAEVARLQREGQEARIRTAGDVPAENLDPALQAAFKTWAARATLLKQRAEQMPDKKLPEFRFLTEKDWFDAVKDAPALESDADFRRAMSNLRNSSKSIFGRMLQQALRAYGGANDGQLPTDLAQLKPFLPATVDDSVLARYSLLERGKLPVLPKGQYLVAETAQPVDEEYDTVQRFSLNGINSSTVNRVEEAVKQAGIQFAQANQGMLPTDAAQLAPYLNQPLDPASIQKVLSQIPKGITTLDQLKATGIMDDGGAPRPK